MASEIVITMVPNSPQVEEVVTGPQGILEGTRKGLIIVDMSTIAPAVSRKMARGSRTKGAHFLDAPVSGGSQGAINGTLTIMVGGEHEICEQVRPIFEAMGKKENIFYVGEHGAGEVVKLVNNMLVGTIAAATAEALVMGVKAGADVETMAKIIGVSTGASWQLSNQFPLRAFNGSFQPGFMTDLLHKDLGLALDLAAEIETPYQLQDWHANCMRWVVLQDMVGTIIHPCSKCWNRWEGLRSESDLEKCQGYRTYAKSSRDLIMLFQIKSSYQGCNRCRDTIYSV